MKIDQCHISKSVHDFPFRRLYELKEYYDSSRPLIVFGCYDEYDLYTIQMHPAKVIIWWCGQDALDFKEWDKLKKPNVYHVAERVKVYEHLTGLGITCKLNKCTNLAEQCEVTRLGKKIFAYCPASYPEYHGGEIIKELQNRGHDIIIGDGSINQNDWRAGACNAIYNECFIGLVLSHFAGGGASVIELGMRGRKCVTNVVNLGNVINWRNIRDIEKAIEAEKKYIGKYMIETVINTQNSLDFNNKFLNLKEYE